MAKIAETYSAHTKSLDENGNPASAEIHYIVFEVNNEDEALQAVYDYVAKDINGMKLDRVEIDDRADDTTFKVNALYERSDSSMPSSDGEEDEEATVSFDCGGGTRHVTTAIDQIRIYKKGEEPNKIETDHSKMAAGLWVNWNGKTSADGMEIKGVDVPTANFRETYTKVMRSSQLTTAFKRKVGNLVGCVNKTEWKGWEKGEAMFLGCSYTAPLSGSDKVVVTFNFEIRLNEKNLKLPNGQYYTNKRGHDYSWSVHDKTVNTEEKKINIGIKEIYIAQVCKYRDFSALGL